MVPFMQGSDKAARRSGQCLKPILLPLCTLITSCKLHTKTCSPCSPEHIFLPFNLGHPNLYRYPVLSQITQVITRFPVGFSITIIPDCSHEILFSEGIVSAKISPGGVTALP